MQRVLVVDKNRKPLMPCHPARARELLKKGKAAVLRRYPFTIILKEREGGTTQPLAVKIDPGSHTTGVALATDFERGKMVVWAGKVEHRGDAIHEAMLTRQQVRRSRRQRKTRYRQPRFLNRRRKDGWLPPSLLSRIQNIMTWVDRLCRFCPVTSLSLEWVKFDTQLLQNPDIAGIAYQQGTLEGYEVREYLLEKWQRHCAYCGIEHVPLQIEHIIPKSRGGTDRITNLTLACEPCNQRKDNQTAAEFGFLHIQAQAQQPLKDAAALNSTRKQLYTRLKAIGLPLELGTGGRTKFNRTQQKYAKAHWIDAACVGESGEAVAIPTGLTPLYIRAVGRQSRQMCRMNQYGFPRTKSKQNRYVHGFQTGDMVRAVVPKGKKVGTVIGRVAVRRSGYFRVGTVDGIGWQFCHPIHLSDGYEYTYQKEE